MISFEDYMEQSNGISDSVHTDEGYNDHDDHNDHVDVWVDEGSEPGGHSGHADMSD